jgi:hypothetical protein
VFDHLGDLMLRAEKRAGEIDGDRVVPTGFGNSGRRATLAERAGVVERDIQPAERLDRQRDVSLASSDSRRAPTTTLAPSAANSLAVTRPMPELAPVTIATLF